MSEKGTGWRKRCSELNDLLEKTKAKAEYYQGIAQASGKKSLQEIVNLNKIIVEQKRAEKALEISEQKYKDLVNNALVGVCRTNLQGELIFANNALLEMLEFNSKDRSPGSVLDSYKNSDDRKLLIRELKKNGSVSGFELELVTKTGKAKHVLVSAILNGDIISGTAIDISERKEKEEANRKRDRELEIKATSLEEVNTTLRVLMEKRENDKKAIEERILSHVKDLVFPYLEKLKNSSLDTAQASCLAVVESNLTNIVSPFAQRLSSKYLALTPTEIRVAGLIKDGKNTKDIANFMHLSPRTVDCHRDRIRKKLGIKNRKANLRNYLSFLD
mgnify:CR=1 FL=1